jgi:nodulation protein F
MTGPAAAEPMEGGDGDRWEQRFEQIIRDNVRLLTGDMPLRPDTNLVDLGLSSLGMISLMVEVEAEYAITISEDLLVLDTFATPGALWTAVRRLRA